MIARFFGLSALVLFGLGATSSEAFVAAPPMPDLVVGKISTSQNKVKIRVHNVGKGKAQPSKLRLQVYSKAGKLLTQRTALVHNLPSGAHHDVLVNTFPTNLPPGTRLVVTLDVGHNVQESNEMNNTKIHFVTIGVVVF